VQGIADLPTEDVRGGSDGERAAAFSSYVAYCGSYELRAMSLFPNWVGSEQTRYFELTGEELVLRTPRVGVGGGSLVNELRWHREQAAPS
jgi:Lipocalin-like domain